MRAIPNSYPLLREAKVTSTNDPEKLGRIQLRVYPELAEITPESDLPWCFPFSGGIHGKSFRMPLTDQLVSCIIWNKYWNEITFLPFNITKPTEHLFDTFMSEVWPAGRGDLVDPEEQHLVVERYEDDFSEFHDTKNKQHGWIHSAGAHSSVSQEGKVECIAPDTDIKSDAPVGIYGGEKALNADLLTPYWEAEKDAADKCNTPPGPSSPAKWLPVPPLMWKQLSVFLHAIKEGDSAALEAAATIIK